MGLDAQRHDRAHQRQFLGHARALIAAAATLAGLGAWRVTFRGVLGLRNARPDARAK